MLNVNQVARGHKVTVPGKDYALHIWTIIGAEISEQRGLLLLHLEREECGEIHRNQEFARDCEAA